MPSTGTVCGAMATQRGRMGSVGTLAKLPLCYKRYVLSHPRLHLPLRPSYQLGAGRWRRPPVPSFFALGLRTVLYRAALVGPIPEELSVRLSRFAHGASAGVS